jgi:pimeloyl-ACP methyl ester carboxylesterase
VADFTTERVGVAQTELMLLRGGSGRPVLVLHGIEGHEGWLEFHDELAEFATVYAPSHPGYGHTEAPEWITSIPHQAVFYNWFLQQTQLDTTGVDVVGLGIGGWIAAHMAIMCGASLRHLVLVDSAGIRPHNSEILDVFVTPWQQVIESAFFDAQSSAEYQRLYAAPLPEYGGVREAARTMSMRMLFRPYMHDPSLAGMLGKVRIPTLIVWAREDGIVPLECADLFKNSIDGATLRVIEACGHFAHLEQPRAVATLVRDFCSDQLEVER